MEAIRQTALDIMNTGLYSLTVKRVPTTASKEVVLMRLNAEATNFERYNFSSSFRRHALPWLPATSRHKIWWTPLKPPTGYRVTLENTGWVCSDPDFNPKLPYENRDKRFYRAILANGMHLKRKYGRNVQSWGIDDGIVSEEVRPLLFFYAGYIQEAYQFWTGQGNQPTSTIGQVTVMRKPCSPMQNPWLMLFNVSTTLMRLMCIQHCGLSTK